jgi:hypothetical protein
VKDYKVWLPKEGYTEAGAAIVQALSPEDAANLEAERDYHDGGGWYHEDSILVCVQQDDGDGKVHRFRVTVLTDPTFEAEEIDDDEVQP